MLQEIRAFVAKYNIRQSMLSEMIGNNLVITQFYELIKFILSFFFNA